MHGTSSLSLLCLLIVFKEIPSIHTKVLPLSRHNLAKRRNHDPQWSQSRLPDAEHAELANRFSRVAKMSALRAGLLLLFVTVGVAVLGHSRAQAENLESGRSAQKLFSGNCSTCHSNPRTLARRMNNWALTQFLQEHYTASQTAAYELAAYLIAVGDHSPRGKRHPAASEAKPQQSWAIQTSAPVERPPESVPTR